LADGDCRRVVDRCFNSLREQLDFIDFTRGYFCDLCYRTLALILWFKATKGSEDAYRIMELCICFHWDNADFVGKDVWWDRTPPLQQHEHVLDTLICVYRDFNIDINDKKHDKEFEKLRAWGNRLCGA